MLSIMLMVWKQTRLYAVTLKQMAGVACILAGDPIDRGEKIERPQRYISHIADWRGDDIEPWAQFRCRFTSQGHLN